MQGFSEFRSPFGALIFSGYHACEALIEFAWPEALVIAGTLEYSKATGCCKLCVQEHVLMHSASILCHWQELKNSSDQDRRTRLGGNLPSPFPNLQRSGGREQCTGAGGTPDLARTVACRSRFQSLRCMIQYDNMLYYQVISVGSSIVCASVSGFTMHSIPAQPRSPQYSLSVQGQQVRLSPFS